MKYRDPSIRACTGAPKPIKIKRPGPTAVVAPTVHRVAGPKARGDWLPEPQRDALDFLPGGLPPEPNRTPWRRAGLTGKGAREPFNSREAKGEFYSTRKYLEG
jgi:hypothetical protein